MRELEFVRRVHTAGGRVAIVGGWVRDSLRGETPKDKDYVVVGLDETAFLSSFPEAQKVGRAFPVFLLRIDGKSSEIALARTERKTGKGYRGFAARADGYVTLEEDLSRRDTTMNAMALELFPAGRASVLIDPFSGENDIRQGRIRAISDCFLEDPVRALRAARQAAVFGYMIEPHTVELMRACREELIGEPQERILGELSRALAAPRPSAFFRALLDANLLDAVFPELFALIGKTQPKDFHPEGDAFEHTMTMVDVVAGRTEDIAARFAALVHDLGKGMTPIDMLPHHYDHEKRGIEALAAWDARMTLPKLWRRVAEFVIAEHMRAPRLKKPKKIAALIVALSKLPIPAREVLYVFEADHVGLPPYLARY
ncbi:MAG: HD domain-containing protein, partial [Schwartzia sp.]|nr:HD domain-containing protein [Schwartzia sp. (in: firmicutes)]